LGEVFNDLERQKESQIFEGYLQLDHISVLILIPPKYSVEQIVGYVKSKSAIRRARSCLDQLMNYTVLSFWVRGYFVPTVGTDEYIVRAYIKKQEKEDHSY